MDFSHAHSLMTRAEAAAGAFLSGRDDTQGRMPSAS